MLAAPVPSTPLGPFEDSAVAWTTWVTLMGFVGLAAFTLIAGPVAGRIDATVLTATTRRLAAAAVLTGLLAGTAVLTDLAHEASDSGGYDYRAAWAGLYDGSNAGRLAGLEVTLTLAGVALLTPLLVRRVAAGAGRGPLLTAGLLAGGVALGTTKFPAKVPTNWPRTTFETLMWMLHLIGGAIWLGGLVGLLLLLLPGVVPADRRGRFWSPVIRRFSVAATSCVAAIGLSGLFLYWEHVDGPGQLFTTMYGRVLGVKILFFGALLVLGAANQFWLHPRIEALRAGGDERPLRTILLRRFPGVVATEVLLVLAVLFVAPFLHGSARNQAFQAFQADAAKHGSGAGGKLPKIATKQVSGSTWVWGTTETVVVVGLLAGGYRISGRIARERAGRTAAPAASTEAGDLVDA